MSQQTNDSSSFRPPAPPPDASAGDGARRSRAPKRVAGSAAGYGRRASRGAEPTAQTLEDLLRQRESLRAFVESISSELDLRPLLTRIIRHACELIGADQGTIGLVDPERGVVRTEAVYRMPPQELGMEVPPSVGLAGQVLLRREPIVLRRYGDVPNPVPHAVGEDAVIGMPISWRGEMIGFFGIGIAADPKRGNRPRRHFTETDVESLALFARHAAIAIHNARRYAGEQRRTERLELIARIGRIVTANLRLGELLQSSADAIHELLGYPNVAIPLIDPADPETLVLRVVGGFYRDIVQGEYRLPITRGIMGAAVRDREVLLVNDVAADSRHFPTPGAEGITAELAVPILLGERVLGVLNVESGEPFSAEDAAGLRIIADQLAVAIENARLYERAQQLAVFEERQRLARELHDSVTQHLFGVTLIAQSLDSAWKRDPAEGERRAGRVLDLSRTALAEMRALLAELHPAISSAPPLLPADSGVGRLRREGLPAALRQHIAAAATRGLRIRLDTQGYQPQPFSREEALLRISQEALHNAVKHARARAVTVRLRSDGTETRLSIRDDGDGFDPARTPGPNPGSGLGLRSMRERAEALGGRLRVVSAPGQGTRVTVLIPSPPDPSPEQR